MFYYNKTNKYKNLYNYIIELYNIIDTGKDCLAIAQGTDMEEPKPRLCHVFHVSIVGFF